MRVFLGAFMVRTLLLVSGEEHTSIDGFLNESVLLPCNCPGINLEKDFRWQIDGTFDVVYKYNYVHDVSEKYKNRFVLITPMENSTCSLKLTNITADDQKTFICSYFYNQEYVKKFVHLNVHARYNVCVETVSEKHFLCDVKGHYRDADIQWKLDGDSLKNSTMDDISDYYSWNASTGLYQFHSKFTTYRYPAKTPLCHVEAKGVPTRITEICPPKYDGSQEIPQNSWRYFVIVPASLVLGIFIYLCYRFRLSRKQQQLFCNQTENEYDSVNTLPV